MSRGLTIITLAVFGLFVLVMASGQTLNKPKKPSLSLNGMQIQKVVIPDYEPNSPKNGNIWLDYNTASLPCDPMSIGQSVIGFVKINSPDNTSELGALPLYSFDDLQAACGGGGGSPFEGCGEEGEWTGCVEGESELCSGTLTGDGGSGTWIICGLMAGEGYPLSITTHIEHNVPNATGVYCKIVEQTTTYLMLGGATSPTTHIFTTEEIMLLEGSMQIIVTSSAYPSGAVLSETGICGSGQGGGCNTCQDETMHCTLALSENGFTGTAELSISMNGGPLTCANAYITHDVTSPTGVLFRFDGEGGCHTYLSLGNATSPICYRLSSEELALVTGPSEIIITNEDYPLGALTGWAWENCGGSSSGACVADGQCYTTEDEATCTSQYGGVFHQGESCEDQPGACCTGETCYYYTQSVCDGLGNNWLGYGTTCDPNPCGLN